MSIVNKQWALEIGRKAQASASLPQFARYLRASVLPKLPHDTRANTWYTLFKALAAQCAAELEHVAWRRTMSLTGNIKLPFAAWSTLPVVTCPGAGACAVFCYSFTAWRNPTAYMRQLRNTLMLRHRPDKVAQAWRQLPHGIDFRLYVDGDFDSVETVAFWMRQCHARPDLRVYGYSKSWRELLAYHESGQRWPDNYTLNLSNGSRFDTDPELRPRVESLPISRGQFVVVRTRGKYARGQARYSDPAYHAEVRELLREKYQTKRVLSCGGDCGNCGSRQHWCGDKQLHNIVIGIGVH